jgi:NADH-quinone oxidoreductase subunit N
VNLTVNTDALQNALALLPPILLTALAAVVLLLDVFWPESRRRDIGLVASVGMFAIAFVSVLVRPFAENQQLVFGGLIRYDALTQLFVTMTLVGGGIACLISLDSPYVGRRGEFYAVLIVATLGACLMAGAADLILIFLALETLSISLYVLAGFLRGSPQSAEAGIKYFLFGAFTSTIMLYCFSLLYGFTGQTNLYAIGDVLSKTKFVDAAGAINPNTSLPFLLAMITVLVGFGFKVSAVPFHFWTPDVYEARRRPSRPPSASPARRQLRARLFHHRFPGRPDDALGAVDRHLAWSR